MKALKYALYAVGALLALALIAAIALALLVDVNRFKVPIESAVKQATQRTLDLEGKLKLTFFPSIGVSTGKATLSERNSPRRFASVDSAQVSVGVLPLLRGELVVSELRLDGLQADLVRGRDGRLNYDDLLPRAGAAPAEHKPAVAHAEPVRFDISGIRVTRAAISYRDETTGRSLAVSDLDLRTGRIAPDVPGKLSVAGTLKGIRPALDLHVALSGNYRFNLESKAVALSDIDAKATGSVAGISGLTLGAKGDVAADPSHEAYSASGLALEARGRFDGQPFQAKLAAPRLSIAADRASGADITAELKLDGAQRKVEAKLELSGVTGSAKALHVPKLAANLTVSDPALAQKTLSAALSGQARADFTRHTAAAELAGRLDESKVQARIGLASFTPPHVTFDVGIDRLNLDRYLPAGQGAAASSKAEGPARQADTPLDFSALKGLNGEGSVHIGAFTAHRVKLANLKAQVRAANGRLQVSPHSADLYQGALAGSLALDASGNRLALKETLSNVSVGPLVRDLAGRDAIEGRGNVSLDITASGASVGAMKKSLAGSARVQLRDGAIKGIDLAATLRKAQALLVAKSAQEQPAAGGQQTDFTDLSASFAIRNGVAHNDDLSVKAPFFRINGAGDIDIGDSKLDYLAKASVVASAKGQGGAELAQLAGLTVPVRLSGPFDAPKYRVDFGAVATELLKSRLTEKLKEELQGKPAQGGSTAKDLLRGIFRR